MVREWDLAGLNHTHDNQAIRLFAAHCISQRTSIPARALSGLFPAGAMIG